MERAVGALTVPGRGKGPEAGAAGIRIFHLFGILLGLAAPATALAAADGAEGKRLFDSRCAVCHSIRPEFHKEGPSLAGVYGRRAGTAPFFPRYLALKGSDAIWTDATLDAWLADPRAFAGGRNTAMTLKLTDANERASVIAYLKTLR